VGTRADVTILEKTDIPWVCHDASGEELIAPQKLSPVGVVKSGQLLQPHLRLLRDLVVAS
ncbi:MAG: amidohydrolase, partial [Cyanobacteria bacterium P01_D01_bin.6]